MFSSNTSQVSNDAVYIEDVFSTWLYTGNGSTQTITNGIDLAGKGGLVWLKSRSLSAVHTLVDTARGSGKTLFSDLTNAQATNNAVTAFNSNGFTMGDYNNTSPDTYASWTFRKQPKFFDVVTYTGNGTANRSIAHSLGSVPGCIIIKKTNSADWWMVYHRSISGQYLLLQTTDAATTFNWITADASTFTLTTPIGATNGSASSYVAYLFAHNAGGFGLTGTDNVISCGSFTADGSGNATVSLGYEPQWIMIKGSDNTAGWGMWDTMRGLPVGGPDAYLFANSSAAEATFNNVDINATGFNAVGWGSSSTYIYIAIRRGPMKTPTTGTSVFSPNTWTSGTGSSITTNFPVDMQIGRWMGSGDNNLVQTRLAGVNTTTTNSSQPYLITNSTAAETSATDYNFGYNNLGFLVGGNNAGNGWAVNFRRAPGFFDVVCYTGTGSARTVNHNLGVVPELMIVKLRDSLANWFIYSSALGSTKNLFFSSSGQQTASAAIWNSTDPTAAVFSVGTSSGVNGSGNTYVAYLFASCPGVSKVGSYTGTGALQTINCGFTGGARFVLIKRTDSIGDWYVYDSARGITSGNDPYLFLNTIAAQITNTNYVDTASTGFQVTAAAPAGLNASGGTYIFLAIA